MPSELPFRWFCLALATAALATVLATSVARARATADVPLALYRVPDATAWAHARPAAPPPPPALTLGDSVLGLSGALRVRVVSSEELATIPGAPTSPPGSEFAVPGGVDGHPFELLVQRDFSRKLGSYVGSYEMGYWPAELRPVRDAAYQNPDGFVEVTPANEDTWVSAHFRLRDFLTHDQPDVWPKYIVLREALLDKLELVLADLARRGIPTSHVVVLSGFRTPAYNLALGDASGRARESRHQYGDAADIIIDANGDGRMDDLDHDGRVDRGDVRVIEESVERVERRYPELSGGLGLYDAMGPRGPFAHIDVRGTVARWTRFRTTGPLRVAAFDADEVQPHASGVGRCYATGPSAVLCAGVRRHTR